MSDAKGIVDRIRIFLSSRDWTRNEELVLLAESYANLCKEANQRLQRCERFLNKKMRTEAIYEAENPSSLLDLVSILDFPEFEEWRDICITYNLPEPPRLLTHIIPRLQEAYSYESKLSTFLTEYRRAVQTGNLKKEIELICRPSRLAFFKWGFVIATVLLFISLLGSAYLWFKSVGENEKLKREVVLQKREIQEKSEELKSLESEVTKLKKLEEQIKQIKGIKNLEGVRRFLLGMCGEEDCRDLKEFLNKLTEPSEVERLRKQFEKIRISDEFSELGLEGVVCKEGKDCVTLLKKLSDEVEILRRQVSDTRQRVGVIAGGGSAGAGSPDVWKDWGRLEMGAPEDRFNNPDIPIKKKIDNICEKYPELSECIELRQKQSYISAIKDITDFSKNESLELLVRGVKNCDKCKHIEVLGFSEDTGFEIDDKNKCEYEVKVPDVFVIKKTGLTIKCEGNDLRVAVDSSIKVAQKEKILTAIKRIIIESEGGEKSIIFTQKINDYNCSVKLPELELGKDTNIEIGSCITDTDLRDAIESKQAGISISGPRECSVDYKVGNKGKKVTIKFGVDNNNIQVKTPDIDELVEKEVEELIEKKVIEKIEKEMKKTSDELSLLLDSKLKPLHKDISQIITQIRGILPAAVSATEGMGSTIRGVTENIRRNLDELESKSNGINQIKKDIQQGIQGIKDKIERTIQEIAKSDKSEVTDLEILKEMKKKGILEKVVNEIWSSIQSKCKIKIEVKIKEETIQRLELRFNKE